MTGDFKLHLPQYMFEIETECDVNSALSDGMPPRLLSENEPTTAHEGRAWRVRLEFPILSLNPELRQRCVAPVV